MAAPFAPGHPTTDIGKKPAARVSDMATCVGPPDVIIARRHCAHWLYAGRKKMDNTAHGGMIKAGEGTVDIGGPQFVCPFAIVYSPGQVQFAMPSLSKARPCSRVRLISDMVKAFGNAISAAMLNSIENSGKTVTLVQCAPGSDNANTLSPNGWNDPASTTARAPTGRFIQSEPDADVRQWLRLDNPPTAVILGHEMSHASHMTNGNLAGNPFAGPTVPNDPGGNK